MNRLLALRRPCAECRCRVQSVLRRAEPPLPGLKVYQKVVVDLALRTAPVEQSPDMANSLGCRLKHPLRKPEDLIGDHFSHSVCELFRDSFSEGRSRGGDDRGAGEKAGAEQIQIKEVADQMSDFSNFRAG